MRDQLDFNPILAHIADKLKKDIHSLGAALNNADALRNFTDQSRLLDEIQAGVRSIDVLGGKVNLKGVSVSETVTPPAAPPTLKVPTPDGKSPLGTVDLDALSREIESAGQ